MIWPLLIVAWFALSYGWLRWLSHKVKREDKDEQPTRLPDLPGEWTPEQVRRFVEMKQQREAGLLTDDDIDYFQIHGW